MAYALHYFGILIGGKGGKPMQKALIVEDSRDNRFLYSIYLKSFSENQKVQMVESSEEALKVFQDFDIFLIDFDLPQMNGGELAKKILEGHPRSPYLVCISATPPSSEFPFHKLLPKPISKGAFLNALMQVEEKPAEEEAIPEELMQKYRLRRKDDAQAFSHFLQTSDPNDVAQVKRMSHQIAGSARSFGFDHLESLARKVYQNCEEHDQDPQFRIHLHELIEALKEI